MPDQLAELTLTRRRSGPQGTFGDILVIPAPLFHTVELPYYDLDGNGISDQSISCVDLGRYLVKMEWSEKHQRNVYHLQNVKGRTSIEMHVGNYGGDKTKELMPGVPLKADLLGCIGVGDGYFPGSASAQAMITGSGPKSPNGGGMARFEKLMDGKDFYLTIVEDFAA